MFIFPNFPWYRIFKKIKGNKAVTSRDASMFMSHITSARQMVPQRLQLNQHSNYLSLQFPGF